MAVQTAASTNRENLGSVTLMTYTFTSVVTGDTFVSGLGTNVVTQWYQMTSITTQASAGSSVSNSSGTFTLKPGEDSNSGILFVLARV